MKAYIDKEGRNINVMRYFPLGWKLFIDGDWVANIAHKDRLEETLCELGCH